MRTSVALATHNSERYLAELLRSLASQTLSPFELVVVDDASSDGTEALLRDFAREAPFPVHVHRSSSNRGHTRSFLDAGARCRGDAIAFTDHDDVWLPEKLEACTRALERPETVLVLHEMRIVDSELRDLGRTWPGIRSDAVLPALHANALEFHAPGACMMFRRTLLDVAAAEDRPPSRYLEGEPMGHDEWFFFLGNVCGSVALLATPLLLYRRHEANASGSVPDPRAVRLRPAVDNYRQAASLNEGYGRFLGAAAARAPAAHRHALARGAEQYRRAALHWRLRTSLYELAPRAGRASLLWRLISSGAYRGRHLGGLGPAALPKDLVAGLLLRHRGT